MVAKRSEVTRTSQSLSDWTLLLANSRGQNRDLPIERPYRVMGYILTVAVGAESSKDSTQAAGSSETNPETGISIRGLLHLATSYGIVLPDGSTVCGLRHAVGQ